MDGWSDRVVSALGRVEGGIAESLGLHTGMSSTEFEETLGAFFRWQEGLPLTERFVRLGGQQPNALTGDIQGWLTRIKGRGERVVTELRKTLYELFGSRAVDPERAERLWSRLLGQTMPHGADDDRLVVATTNYDPVAEMALYRLGKEVETGRSSSGVETPRLEPVGLVERALEDSRSGTPPPWGGRMVPERFQSRYLRSGRGVQRDSWRRTCASHAGSHQRSGT